MMKKSQQYVDKFNALTTRERSIIIVSIVVVLLFAWWSFYAEPLKARVHSLDQQTESLKREAQVMQVSIDAINRRISEGVHKSSMQQLQSLQVELQRVNNELNQKTLELIEPNEMFALMRQMVFAESALKLTSLSRKQVVPVFNQQEEGDEQPKIYRHTMQVGFEGRYQDILKYVNSLENIEWKLIWERIDLRVVEYPVIAANIEISTLSDTRHWVGL